jgi:hypothetical protein
VVSRVNQLIDRMASLFAYARPQLDGLLVVVQTKSDDPALNQLRQAAEKLGPQVRVIAWRPEDPRDALENALHEFLAHRNA